MLCGSAPGSSEVQLMVSRSSLIIAAAIIMTIILLYIHIGLVIADTIIQRRISSACDNRWPTLFRSDASVATLTTGDNSEKRMAVNARFAHRPQARAGGNFGNLAPTRRQLILLDAPN